VRCSVRNDKQLPIIITKISIFAYNNRRKLQEILNTVGEHLSLPVKEKPYIGAKVVK